jgi:hypothetical protein
VFRLKAPLSLVAVFVLITVVVAALVGARLVQDWNSFHNAGPAGTRQSQILQLESRPLHIPAVSSPADCVSGPFKAGSSSFGPGPVYTDGGIDAGTSKAAYFHNRAFADTQIYGLVLVRARDLFTHEAVVFVGQYAVGPTVGTDTVNGELIQQHTELLLDPGSPSRNLELQFAQDPHKYTWVFTATRPSSLVQGLPGSPTYWSSSTGWQIDGAGFSEVFLVC